MGSARVDLAVPTDQRSTAASTRWNCGTAAHVEAEVGQLAQGERGQAVATALVAGKARLVDDEHVDPGPVQLDRRGNARRPGADHEDVDGRGHRTMLGSACSNGDLVTLVDAHRHVRRE